MKVFFLALVLVFLTDLVFYVNASDAKKKQKNKIESKLSHKPKYKMNCDQFDEHMRTENRGFLKKIASKPLNDEKNNKFSLSSFHSLEKIREDFEKKCSTNYADFTSDLVQLTWRYQFFESQHCIRVELDFGNVTLFKNYFDYSYYMFSYREIAKPHNYLKRHPIMDQNNSLVIYKVNLKPFIVCVSFYKHNPEIVNTTTNQSSQYCNEIESNIHRDEGLSEIDMCIDIDTQAHFLDSKHDEKILSAELIMCIFIFCFLAMLLIFISISYYIIERPKKKQFLRAVRAYLVRKYRSNSSHHNNQQNSSGMGSKNSISTVQNSQSNLKKLVSSNEFSPSITVTDYSNAKPPHDDPKESDPLLMNNSISNLTSSSNSIDLHSSSFKVESQPKTGYRVMFDIGETIIEEPASLDTTSKQEVSTDEQQSEQNNDECLKTISHLLDDKPWLSSSQSQVGLSNAQNRSYSNLLGRKNSNISALNVHFADSTHNS